MSNPITWRTVSGPNLADSLRPLESAQRSFNGAFDGLAGVLKQRETTDQANWDVTKANNTNDFQDQLMQLDTPEKLAEAQRTGLLDTLRQSFGTQVDRGAIRTAEDGRMGILQNRAVQAGVFQDSTTERTQRPLRDAITAAYANGDMAGGDALRAASPDLVNITGLIDNRNTNQSRITGNTRDTATFEQKQLMWPGEKRLQDGTIAGQADALLTSASQRSTAAAQRGLIASQISLNNAKAAAEAADAGPSGASLKAALSARKASIEKLFEGSIYGSGDYDSKDGKMSVVEGLKKLNFSPSQINDTLYNLGQDFPKGIPVGKDAKGNPQYMPVPVNLIMQAASQSDDNGFASVVPGWSRRGDNLVNIIGDQLKKDGSLLKQMQDSMALKGEMVDPSGALRASLQPANGAASSPAKKANSVPGTPVPVSKETRAMVSALDAEIAARKAKLGANSKPWDGRDD